MSGISTGDQTHSDADAFARLLAQAARLQELVPGAVLVGGSAAAVHARHRVSFDHDHVVADLADRYGTVLDHLESLGDWSTARISDGKLILGELGGIETGVRQMIRSRPLEIEHVAIGDRSLIVPTLPEILRIKAWLAVRRNQTRDYLDLAALSVALGDAQAAAVLSAIDDYYHEVNDRPEAVATQVARQLADPRPRDATVTAQLAEYKGLDRRWHDWTAVTEQLATVAALMLTDRSDDAED